MAGDGPEYGLGNNYDTGDNAVFTKMFLEPQNSNSATETPPGDSTNSFANRESSLFTY